MALKLEFIATKLSKRFNFTSGIYEQQVCMLARIRLKTYFTLIFDNGVHNLDNRYQFWTSYF